MYMYMCAVHLPRLFFPLLTSIVVILIQAVLIALDWYDASLYKTTVLSTFLVFVSN